jgi:DNA-binding transcriptional regulator YiaG
MHTAIDWTTKKYPWSYIGPEAAAEFQTIASGGLATAPPFRTPKREKPKRAGSEPRMRSHPRPALRAARVAAALTRADVGKRLGLCLQNVCNWERGASSVPQRHHAALAEILGVPTIEALL